MISKVFDVLIPILIAVAMASVLGYWIFGLIKIFIEFIKDIIKGDFSWGGGKECHDSWTASSND